jgi:serine phosphatase RsbU (regulator of sigma subunit)
MALGGDFYDALVLPDGSLAAVIGDVTGHGPVAAATGAGLRAAWRAAMINGVPLLEVPGLLERVLLSERESDLSFATALMGLLRPEGRADLIACGHPPPLKISSGSADEVPLPAHVMLGIEPNRGVDVTSIELATEDRLLLYTDGLVEGRAAPGSPERLGPEGVASILDGMADVDPDELIDTVMTRHGGGLRDDVAVLVLGPRATA